VRDDAQIRANGLLVELEQPGLGPVTLLGRVLGLGSDAPPLGPAPRLGEHTEAVLREVGR
jgi:crotonobetainyl-CoA:carnitine CoA-transferase CaiB-like acyl-CoA transferase